MRAVPGPGRHLPGNTGPRVDRSTPVGRSTPVDRYLDRVRAGSARTSLESAASTAALASVGFDTVADVMGATVVHLTAVFVNCGISAYADLYAEPPTRVSGRRGDPMGYGDTVQQAWDTALGRMFTEATRVGADGIVGISATRGPAPGIDSRAEEFLLRGTAVRARSATRPHRPFGTEQHGAGLVALLDAGLVPCGYAVTAAVGIRHDDARTRQANTRWSGNGELPGYTELAQQTRQAARDQFGDALTRAGAAHALAGDVTARMWGIEGGESHVDHLCEVTITGTGLVSYQRATSRPVLTVLPLSGRPLAFGADGLEPATAPAIRPGRWEQAATEIRAARTNRILNRRNP